MAFGSLAGKTIVVGITGSIAAYKAAHVVSHLTALGGNVVVVMTKNATSFVAPLTFQTLSGNEVITDMFPEKKEGVRSAAEALGGGSVRHVELAGRADLAVVAPATANLIGKMASGVADDFLSTELMAMKCPIVLAPAMNVNMSESAAVVENLKILEGRGVIIVGAQTGRLASGAIGRGRLADPDRIVDAVVSRLLPPQDLRGRKILVTGGPTLEPLDPVRHIGNPSTGKMGYALADRAVRRGADVTLVSGPTDLDPPDGAVVVRVRTAAEMMEEVLRELPTLDLLLMAAAVSDYRPVKASEQKIKKDSGPLTIELERTEDILLEVKARKRPGQGVVGFAVETENDIENGKRKLEEKDLDLVIVNNPRVEGSAFGCDTNVATIIARGGGVEELAIMSKKDLADLILSRVISSLAWGDQSGP